MGAVASTNIITDGLVACWDGGNRRCGTPSAGGTWTGLGVNAPAILTNGTEFADISLGAILLDGTDEKVTVANTTDIDGQNGFTFGIWLYFLATPSNDYTCFSIYNGGGGYEFMLYIMDVSVHSKSIMLGTRGTSYSALRSDNTAMSPSNNIGKWVHYCATYNGDGDNTPGNYKIYFNGQDMGSDGTTEFGGGTNTTRWGNDNGYGDLEGYIGRVAFYDRPLSADEVSQNYEATKPRFTPRITKSGMFANWDAGDPKSYNGGQTWTDTANGFTGALNNGGDGSLTFDPANGGSLEFDGTDDRIGPITLPGDYSSTARSVIVWVAVDIYTSGSAEWTILNSPADKFSVSMGQSNYSGGFLFRSAVTNTSTYRGGFSTSGLVDGSWQCFAFTINASNEIVAMYHNGESKSNTKSNAMNLQDDDSFTYIGASSGGGYMLGNIGTVRFYTKTLSAAEILDNYNKTKARFGH